jgi:hypothetical protein
MLDGGIVAKEEEKSNLSRNKRLPAASKRDVKNTH